MPTFTTLISEADIARRVEELGKDIATVYGGEPVLAVCVLKGAVIFFADLVRAMQRHGADVSMEFVRLASYGQQTQSSGKVEFKKDLETSIHGLHVLVVEDIVDTGRSMHYLLQVLHMRGPKSLRVCALVDKAERRETQLTVDFTGFHLQDGFAVGYGMDYAEQYRGLGGIYALSLDGQDG